MARVMSLRDFRLLFAGATTSLQGDQFALIATPWLVPISQAISGAVSKWSLTFLFAAAGVLTLVLTLWAAFEPELKTFSEGLSASNNGA